MYTLLHVEALAQILFQDWKLDMLRFHESNMQFSEWQKALRGLVDGTYMQLASSRKSPAELDVNHTP